VPSITCTATSSTEGISGSQVRLSGNQRVTKGTEGRKKDGNFLPRSVTLITALKNTNVSFFLKQYAFKFILLLVQRTNAIPDACLPHAINLKNTAMSNPPPPPAWAQLKPNFSLSCSALPHPNRSGIFLQD